MYTAQDLAGFYGTENYFFHPLFKTIKYTDGVSFILHNGSAWMITDILSQICHNPILLGQDFLAITFRKNADGSAVIQYTDGDDNVLETQEYSSTDVIVTEIKFFYTDGVLLLASEY
jgi:hypothetical protein